VGGGDAKQKHAVAAWLKMGQIIFFTLLTNTQFVF
jgi:Flp pilus assembly protein protease CpaA